MQRILLIKNKEKKSNKLFGIFTIIALFFMICILSSCQQKLRQYYNCKWTCEKPEIEFTVKSKEETKENENLSEGLIATDEIEIEVLCLWTHTNALHIFFKDKYYNDDLDYVEKIAITANYEKRKSNKVYMNVKIDNVFDNKYKNITLTRHDL